LDAESRFSGRNREHETISSGALTGDGMVVPIFILKYTLIDVPVREVGIAVLTIRSEKFLALGL
jgi:hypothetical protein